MYVLVRIDVSRISTDNVAERCQLTRHLFSHGLGIAQGHYLIERHPLPIVQTPLAEVDVQPEAQIGTGPTQLNRLDNSVLAYHQARAGYDPKSMGPNYSTVNAGALTKIVCIDDKQAPAAHILEPQLVEHFGKDGLSLEIMPCDSARCTTVVFVI